VPLMSHGASFSFKGWANRQTPLMECVNDCPSLVFHAGPMFSGKTSSLILKRAELCRGVEIKGGASNASPNPCLYDKVVVLKCSPKHKEDTLASCTLKSRDGTWCEGFLIGSNVRLDTLGQLKHVHVLIDEAQFLTSQQVEELRARCDCNVICYGLRADVHKRPFPGSAALMASADQISMHNSTCVLCYKPTALHNDLRAKVVAFQAGDKELSDKPTSISAPGEPFVCENSDETYAVLCNSCDVKLNRHFFYPKKRAREEKP